MQIMTSFSNSPKLLKVGIVLIDPVTAAVRRNIALQIAKSVYGGVGHE
jgi:Asp/Glu/hydantoin racemase